MPIRTHNARAPLGRQALVGPAEDVDPTTIGVDAAAQDILPGGEVPEYVARDVDEELRAAIAAAFEGSGRWLVVVIGPTRLEILLTVSAVRDLPTLMGK